jgi:HEPN domain-containing protein
VEVYEGDGAATAPIPIVRPTRNRPARALLDKARELVQKPYMEAAANYARQAFELGVRAACEVKKIEMRYSVDPKAHQSQDFLDKLKQWPGSAAVSKADWDAALARLETLKNVVMNPYSHPSAPNIPKQEVEQAIDAVDQFLKLVAKK